MYKWACLAEKYGARPTLFLNSMDEHPMSMPHWEELVETWDNLQDGGKFREYARHIALRVQTRSVEIDSLEFREAWSAFEGGNRTPLLRQLSDSGNLRLEVFEKNIPFLAYFDWAKALASYEVIYTTSAPFAAYASGQPYCVCSVGGDLQFDCGRGDAYGKTMLLAFNGGRFLMVSKPA